MRRIAIRSTVALALTAGAVVAAALFWRQDRLPSRLLVEERLVELAPTPEMGVRVDKLLPGHELRADAGYREAMVTPPPSRLRFRLPVPAGAVLTFSVGVQGERARDTQTSDVRFTLRVDGRRLFSRDVNPAARRRDRRWFDERVDLGVTEPRETEIELTCEAVQPERRLPGTPGWSHVRVVRDTWRERQRARPDAPSVIVLLVDTLRADRLGCYGAVPTPSPNLDRLAHGGLLFEQAIAAAPWTMPSVASILTGLYPRSHGVIGDPIDDPTGQQSGGGTFLPDTVRTLAEHAADAGISTIGVSGNPLVSRATNLAQGFETFTEIQLDFRGGEKKDWASAAEINRAFLRWLRPNRGLRFLAYLHYMEPHHPYAPPERLRPSPPEGIRPAVERGHLEAWGRQILSPESVSLSDPEIVHLRRLYDADIRWWDEELGQLLGELDALGIRDTTVLLMTSDHGEEFLEHGRLMHGTHLYDESLRVPLVLSGPGVQAGRAPQLASGVDVFPTIASVLGLAPPAAVAGKSLLGEPAPRLVFSETHRGRVPDGRETPLVAVRTASWKLIQAPDLAQSELYDLARDPAERNELFRSAPEGAALQGELAGWVAATPRPPPADHAGDPAIRERLRALGYVE